MTLELKAGTSEFEPVLICHGAVHDLKIAAVADSLWVNQGVSCNKVPGGTFPITTDPQLGAYQKFVATGSEWKLNCPPDGNDIDFSLQLQSEFTAVPYKVALKLGDYRRVILSKRDPISAPVVGDEVVAEVQIGSFYTDKELEGVEVEWYYDGGIVRNVPTTSQGRSTFKYTLTAEGEHTITAKLHSPYDDTTVEQNFTIYVYMESPWEQASLFINGERVAWNSPSVVLFRGQPNEVRIEAPFLQEKDISLGLINQDGLSIEAAPAFEEWVPLPDGTTSWVITPAGNKSGRITLKLSSKETAQAWEVPCTVLSLNLADEADVLVDGVEVPPTGNWFIRDEAQIVTLTVKSGSPLAGLPVTLSCTVGGGLVPGNVQSLPAFDTEQTTYSWAVTGKDNSGTFQLKVTGKGMTTPIALTTSKLISSDLVDEVTVLLDGVEIPLTGLDIPPGGSVALTLVYKNPHLLPGLELALDAVLETGLVPGDLTSEPPLREQTTNHKWVITGAEKKVGTFKLKVFTAQDRALLLTPTIRLYEPIQISFESFGGSPLLLPPDTNPSDTNSFFSYRVALTNVAGQPLVGVPVTFYAPGSPEEEFETTTNSTGHAYNLTLFQRVGVYTIRAVARVAGVDRELEILVDVVAA